METRKFYVYCITNMINGKRYVGKSVEPKRRWQRHVREALTYHREKHLYCSIRKYGADSFKFEIMKEFDSEPAAYEFEREMILEWNLTKSELGYNNTDGGRGGTSLLNEESRQKLHLRMLTNNPMKGKSHSEETKKRISELLTGRTFPHTPEWNKKIGESQRGRSFTVEHKKKLSEAKIGRKFGPRGPYGPHTKEVTAQMNETRRRNKQRKLEQSQEECTKT